MKEPRAAFTDEICREKKSITKMAADIKQSITNDILISFLYSVSANKDKIIISSGGRVNLSGLFRPVE